MEKSQKLSSLKNLGPVLEKVLNTVGIKTVDDLKKLGWKIAITRLVKKSPRYLLPIYSYVMIGALANEMWNNVSHEDKMKVQKFIRGLGKKKKPSKKARKKTGR